jgi:lipid II:glycine glycyltransferase (peptidoglycan interpeptide bridge formation enzyme)
LSDAAAVTHGHAVGRDAWDQLLLGQPEGNLLQSWDWGELQAKFGWTIDRLLVDEGRHGVCSLQRTTTLFPGGAVYYVPRGPAVAEEARMPLLDALERRARTGDGLVLRVEPNNRVGDEWPAFFEGRGF